MIAMGAKVTRTPNELEPEGYIRLGLDPSPGAVGKVCHMMEIAMSSVDDMIADGCDDREVVRLIDRFMIPFCELDYLHESGGISVERALLDRVRDVCEQWVLLAGMMGVELAKVSGNPDRSDER